MHCANLQSSGYSYPYPNAFVQNFFESLIPSHLPLLSPSLSFVHTFSGEALVSLIVRLQIFKQPKVLAGLVIILLLGYRLASPASDLWNLVVVLHLIQTIFHSYMNCVICLGSLE